MKEIDLLFRSCCDYPRDDSLDQLDRIHSLPHSPAHCGVLCPIKLDRIHSLPHSPAHCCVICSIILPHYSSHPIPKLTVQHIHHALLAPPEKKFLAPPPGVPWHTNPNRTQVYLRHHSHPGTPIPQALPTARSRVLTRYSSMTRRPPVCSHAWPRPPFSTLHSLMVLQVTSLPPLTSLLHIFLRLFSRLLHRLQGSRTNGWLIPVALPPNPGPLKMPSVQCTPLHLRKDTTLLSCQHPPTGASKPPHQVL